MSLGQSCAADLDAHLALALTPTLHPRGCAAARVADHAVRYEWFVWRSAWRQASVKSVDQFEVDVEGAVGFGGSAITGSETDPVFGCCGGY
jgi:hypothetical protein